MGNFAQSVERKAFGVAIDGTLKHINKDRDYVQKHDRNHTDNRTDQNDRINRRLTDRRL